MKYIALLAVVLVGCSTTNNPNAYPTQQLVIDTHVSAMSRQEVINAIHDCQSNGMRAVMVTSKKVVSGHITDVISEVTCAPRYFYQERSMVQFLMGLFLGLYVATHNVMEMASNLDQGVQAIKSIKITSEK